MRSFTISSIMAACVAIALFAASFVAAQASHGCYEPNATGFVLSPFPTLSPGGGMCPPGWYCPNSFTNDSSTWPVICPASASCVQQRLNYKICPAQGKYEPFPCTKGYYCPSSYQIYQCPSGSYCPAGSVTPIKCNGLSPCPAGSHTDYFVGLVLVIGLVDIAVVIAYLALRWYLAQPTPLTPPEPFSELPAQTTSRLIREALGTSQPVQISFENLSVRLSSKHETAPNKSLLQGVSGSLRAGEVTAIMGPSGAGKTVLFTTVLGKTPADWTVEGTLRVCGDRTPQDFPHLVGFVPQDDVLRGDLTVAENILYSSEVRLPADWSAERRRELRSAVMRALGIDHVRDVLIGDEETRGVSGGQRKRCSVAVELAAAPAVIFLDEPTTGLDATSSLELVRLLKIVAREARIPVAMVIHQPRVEIWNELDSVLLLAPGGRTVYSGQREGVRAHLSRLLGETVFENKGNPADIVMDLIAENGQLLADDWQRDVEATTPLLAHTDVPARTMASPLKQMAMAHARAVIGSSRNGQAFLLDIFLGMLGGTLLTAAATDSALEAPYAGQLATISPRVDIHKPSMLMMLWGIALAAGLGPAGIRALGSKRPQYWREAASGYSRWAYYIGASTAEMYRVLLTMLHFTAVVYLMWKPYTPFGTLYWVLLMYAVCIDGQSVALGNLLPPSIAPLLATVIGVFSALMNGFPTIPGSFAFYPFALTEMEYTFEMDAVKSFYRWEQIDRVWGYKKDNLGADYVNILCWLFGLRVIGYILMVATNRDKQR